MLGMGLGPIGARLKNETKEGGWKWGLECGAANGGMDIGARSSGLKMGADGRAGRGGWR